MRLEELTIDVSGILDDQTLHEYLFKVLQFPGYYGFNFDALWDCISCDEQSVMPQRLIVKGMSELKQASPDTYALFMECLKDYQKEFPDRELRFF